MRRQCARIQAGDAMIAMMVEKAKGPNGDLAARTAVCASMNAYIHQCVRDITGIKDHKNPMYLDCYQAAVAGTVSRGGLLHAIDTYDSSRGTRFITHASYWIRAAIFDTAADHPVIGVRVRQRHARIRRMAHGLGLDETPSVEQVKAAWEENVVDKKERSISLKSIAEALSSDIPPGWTVQGLDSPDVDRDEIIDEDVVIDAIDRRAKVRKLEAAIANLKESDRKLIVGMFGFNGTPISIASLAQDAGCSKTTIIRKRNAILNKLRHALAQ
jgi:RNA polymerase sigma factor (sigma-70 family)